MKAKLKIRKEIKIGVALAVLFFFVAFTERKLGSLSVNEVIIKVENVQDNHFKDEQDILNLIRLDRENLKGAELSRLNLKEIEARLKSDRFIQDADLYSDIKGNLIVKAILRRPIARIIRNDGPDAYIAEDGTIMPVSTRFTARVLLIGGTNVQAMLLKENIASDDEGRQLLQLLTRISGDSFWRAQIAQININGKNRLTMLPQVGAQTIEFGTAENMEEKLKKLKIFYKEILPQMGWSRYHRVNVEYNGQLVAE
jgi:cell division protein FtsQ